MSVFYIIYVENTPPKGELPIAQIELREFDLRGGMTANQTRVNEFLLASTFRRRHRSLVWPLLTKNEIEQLVT